MEALEKPLEPAATASTPHITAPLTNADRIRLAIADAASDAAHLCDELKLPRSEDSLHALESALRQNRFTVLVCGEAKRGKSTFINALIGRNLLPTDIDIATSQVFQIRSGVPPFDQLAFQVRYEDDSAQYIEQDDLAKIGCQVVQDSREQSGKPAVTRPDQIVRQIEVTVPSGNLPPEITLLDTPGIGSLYSGHAKITYRFIPFADAVIFVLDSQAPITEPELAFLSEILTVTQNIFFLQTRIDQFQQNDWRAVYDRNRQILTEKFGDVIATASGSSDGVVIWPVSSHNVLVATRTRSRELLQVSRFPAMLQALRRFLYVAAGEHRMKNALAKLNALHYELQHVLDERAGVLEGGEKARSIEEAHKQRLDAFAAEWGPESPWRHATDVRLTEIEETSRSSFDASIAIGSDVEIELQRKISALTDIANAERLARSLASDAVERANLIWRTTAEEATDSVSDLIAPLCGKLRGDSALMSHFIAQTLSVADVTAAAQTERIKDTLANRTRIAWQESGVLGGVGAAVSMVIGRLFAITPLTSTRGAEHLARTGGELADKVKPELGDYLQKVLREIRETYRIGENTSESPTESFFMRLRGAAYNAMDSEYGRRSIENQTEVRRLFELTTVRGDAAVIARAQAQTALDRWAQWGKQLRSLEWSLEHPEEEPVILTAARAPVVEVTAEPPAPLPPAAVAVEPTLVMTAVEVPEPTIELTPQQRYQSRFHEALLAAGGFAGVELPDAVLDELDVFAVSLGLQRSQVRETERAARRELETG